MAPSMAKWSLNEAVVVRWYCCHMVQNIPNFKVVITSSTSLADDSVAIEMHDSKSEDADSSVSSVRLLQLKF